MNAIICKYDSFLSSSLYEPETKIQEQSIGRIIKAIGAVHFGFSVFDIAKVAMK
ncbi:Uncharacterised protein r2_g8 [Pycnogonum litorale]